MGFNKSKVHAGVDYVYVPRTGSLAQRIVIRHRSKLSSRSADSLSFARFPQQPLCDFRSSSSTETAMQDGSSRRKTCAEGVKKLFGYYRCQSPDAKPHKSPSQIDKRERITRRPFNDYG
ncbi:hypothetical protein VTN00DRAFT_906 [Thermoascus crustaceus]|uniref:uncharacterized protein n=1 Tax=Thermoascus crustaceus TaxID=5088 RepID=UPI003742BF4E